SPRMKAQPAGRDGGSPRLPWNTTSAPAWWRPWAMARPMPLEEPVTRADLPASENAFILELEIVENVFVPGQGLSFGRQRPEAIDFLLVGAAQRHDRALGLGHVALEGAVRAPHQLLRIGRGQGLEDGVGVAVVGGEAPLFRGDEAHALFRPDAVDAVGRAVEPGVGQLRHPVE